MAVREITDEELENIIVTAPAQQTMTAGQVAKESLFNIPSSALQFGKDIVTPY